MKKSQKAFAIIVPLALALFAAFQLSSCEKYVLSALDLSTDTLKFNAPQASSSISVESNVHWKRVDSSQEDDWVTLSPEEGTGDCNIIVTVEENSGSSERTATVSISSEIIKKSFLVIQQGSGE